MNAYNVEPVGAQKSVALKRNLSKCATNLKYCPKNILESTFNIPC